MLGNLDSQARCILKAPTILDFIRLISTETDAMPGLLSTKCSGLCHLFAKNTLDQIYRITINRFKISVLVLIMCIVPYFVHLFLFFLSWNCSPGGMEPSFLYRGVTHELDGHGSAGADDGLGCCGSTILFRKCSIGNL